MKKIVAVSALLIGLAPAAMAGEAHLDTIHAQCGIQLKLSEAGCTCLRSAAASELNENQQAFMAATVVRDKTEAARLQALLSQEEAVGVGTFMTAIVGRCS